jgi:hypothetical protein
MPDQHKAETIKFICNGMAPGIASDLRPQGKFNFLQNVRIFMEGVLEGRPRVDTFLTFSPSIGSNAPYNLKTIINKSNGSFLRIAAAAGKIFTGSMSVLTEKSSGYSGKPVFMVDFRPEASAEAYVYIADENKFEKVSVSDNISSVGLTAPRNAATYQIGKPERKIIDAISTGSDADWNNLTGTAGAPTLVDRINTTVSQFVPDGALPNFASIVPAALSSELQKDSIVLINGADNLVVEEVIPAALGVGVATITKITYDVGVSGLATIVLSVPTTNVKRDSILLLNGTEYVRVLDTTMDDNGIPSIRVSTVGTFVAGNTVSGVSSFRVYTTTAYTPGQTITNKAIKSVIAASGVSAISRTFNVDLSNTGTKAVSTEDVFHASLRVSDPQSITEIQIQMDVNSGANNFQENYFFYVLNPNFFTASAEQTTPTVSVIQQTVQRQQLYQNLFNRDYELRYRYGSYGFGEPYDPYDIGYLDITDQGVLESPVETTLGRGQWTEANIKLHDFKRVGADASRTLKDVKAIRISVTATAAVDIYLDSLWIGGTDALGSNAAQGFLPYNYVWRARDPATKNKSNWSPPLRTGIKLSRGRVELTFPDANIDYPTSYKIDVARFGGTLNTFRIIGSIDNDGSIYIDTSSDKLVADNPIAGRFDNQGDTDAVFNFYKPFAILDTDKRGTCDVIGTKWIWKTGDKLNVTYPRGTQIVINGKANKFYSSPLTDSLVELENDMGALTDVKFELISPLLTGQPLPVIFGPFGEGNFGLIIFGIGDRKNAGTLYWLDGNSPDTQSDLNSLEVTSPSEPLVSGVMYDGYGIVYTTRRSFTILPTFTESGFSFIARENANSRGLFSRNTIVVGGDYIYFLSENADGIYKVQGGGNPQLVTGSVIDNFFYNNGKAPSAITLIDGTVINPPDFTDEDNLRLYVIKDHLYFRFKDTAGKQRCLVFDIHKDILLSYDAYPSDIVDAFYFEEKESSAEVLVGILNGVGRFSDAGTYEDAIEAKIIPFSFDGGDSRVLKTFDEFSLSAEPGLANGFNYKHWYDDGESSSNLGVVPNGPAKRTFFILDDIPKLARNITTAFSWLLKEKARLYEQRISFIVEAEKIVDRTTSVENAGGIGAKLWQGVVIEANTFGQDKTLKYINDRNVEVAAIVINHAGRQTISYSFPQSFISHNIRRTSNDNKEWIPYVEAYIYDEEPEAGAIWEGEFNTGDLTGLLIIKRFAIAYRATTEVHFRITSADDTYNIYTLPTTNGEWNKVFMFAKAQKSEGFKYLFSSNNDLRIYKKDCEVWIKSTNDIPGFVRMNPFGGISRVSEILI